MKFNPGPALLVVSSLLLFYCLLVIKTKSSRSLPSPWLIEVHQRQATRRRHYLSLIRPENGFPDFAYLYNNLAPEAHCPEKVKVGTTDDGGKWMCSPRNLPNGCTIFALGISGVITFEEDIQAYSEQRCRVVSVDSAKQSEEVVTALEKIRGTVVQAVISPVDNGTMRTMDSILEKEQVEEVEILKIDIEGAELYTMQTFLDKYIVSQIMVEVHGTPFQTLNFLKMIASKGYLLFHYEINGRYHQLCEYAFIHETRLERYDASLLANYLRPLLELQ